MESQARGGSEAPAAAARRRLRVQAGRILATLSAVYIIAQFYRSSVAVIAPDLARDIGLSAEALGGMTAAFFLAYAVAVVPAGMMFDRIGPRRTISALLLVGVTGSLVFATAAGTTGLTVGRILMGVGSAGILSGALVVCARWFPGTRYATVVGLLIGVGTTGNLLATTPLALASEWIGWRWAFVGVAGVTLTMAAVYFLIVRDAPPDHPYHEREPESWRQVFAGLFEAWRTPDLAYIIAIHTATYGSLLTILGLWGGPYLFDVHGMTALERGNVLLAMTLAAMGGSVAYGPLDRLFDTRKGVIMAGAAVTVAVLAALALAPALAVWQVSVLFAALGGATGYAVVILAHARAIFPDRLAGRGLTTLTVGNFSGIAFLQIASGLIIGATTGEDGLVDPLGYRYMFGFLAVIVALALVCFTRITDTKPSQQVARAANAPRARTPAAKRRFD